MHEFGTEQLPSPERRLAVANWIRSRCGVALNILEEAPPIDYETPEGELEIRGYQLDAWDAIWQARERGERSGLLHLATGLGKTIVSTLDFKKFQEEQTQAGKPEPRGLFACNQDIIPQQALPGFERFIPGLSTGFFQTKRSQLPQAGMTGATFQSLYREIDRFPRNYFNYIVWDEGHHAKASTFERVVDHFEPEYQLALTATPQRADGQDIRELFGEPVYSKGLPEGIAEGWLVKPSYHVVFDKAVRDAIDSGFDPKTLKELKRLLKTELRSKAIAQDIQAERHRIGLDEAKTIVFCDSIRHAEEMAALLGGRAYHSDTKDGHSILQDFRSGRLQIICTVDKFNEGVDVPDARLLAFIRSTKTLGIFEQQLGRGLRRMRGKSRVYVLDFVGNADRVAWIDDLQKAIQKHERRTRSNQATTRGTDTEGRVQVHTEHSDFEFDRRFVNILEKYRRLKPDLTPPPEGAVSLTTAGRMLGIQPHTVRVRCEAKGWTLPEHKFARGPGLAVMPEQLEELKNWDSPEITGPMGEGEEEPLHSLPAIGEQYDISDATLQVKADEQGWKLRRRRVNGQLVRMFTQTQINTLKREYPELFVAPAPEGVISLNEACKEMGIVPATGKTLVADMGLPEFKFGGSVALGLNPTQLAEFKDNPYFEIEAADEKTIISVNALAKLLGLTRPRAQMLVDDTQVPTQDYRFGTNTGPGIKREAIPIIEAARDKMPKPRPEGWSSVKEAARELTVSPAALRRVIIQKGWDEQIYMFGTKEGIGLSPDQVELLRTDEHIQKLLARKNQD